MDLRVLRQFLNVASLGSIGKAAEASHITQPALSKSIRRLEQALDVELFERTGLGTQPTAFGQALVEHANVILKDVERLREHMADLREGRLGHVTIGAGSSILDNLIARATADLCSRNLGLRVTAVAGPVDQLMPDMLRGDLDLVIGVRPANYVDARVAYRPLFRDEIGVVVRKGHPLLRRRNLSLADIEGARWILPSPDHTFTKSCLACFAAAGLMGPTPAVVSGSLAFTAHVVRDTDFLTYMPLPLVQSAGHPGALAHLRVPNSTWRREAILFQRAGSALSPAAAELVAALQRAVSV
jgi:DNA-binding transcriptional LysR family regulator